MVTSTDNLKDIHTSIKLSYQEQQLLQSLEICYDSKTHDDVGDGKYVSNESTKKQGKSDECFSAKNGGILLPATE